MRRFTLLATGMAAKEKRLWQQAGYELLPDARCDWLEDAEPAVIWLTDTETDATADIMNLRPRVFFVRGRVEADIWQKWCGAYACHTCGDDSDFWSLGTKLETPLPDRLRALLLEENIAGLADVLYEYLFRDVLRETAEWCGHMSSVVRRM